MRKISNYKYNDKLLFITILIIIFNILCTFFTLYFGILYWSNIYTFSIFIGLNSINGLTSINTFNLWISSSIFDIIKNN